MMPQTTQSVGPVDPVFVENLRASITGIYFHTVEDYTPDKIASEFRKAAGDRNLMQDEDFVGNLMFLVRKRNVTALHDDVVKVLSAGLPAGAETSGLKTLFALGDARDRETVDQRVSSHIETRMRGGAEPSPSSLINAADRIGGPKSLKVLKDYAADVARRQAQAEKTTPDDHQRIVRLDRMRDNLENRAGTLASKLEIAGKPEKDRAAAMAEEYLRRSGHVGIWSYKELVDHATPAAIEGVRLTTRNAAGLLPAGGLSNDQRAKMLLEHRLRGTCLLESMKAPLTAEEKKLLADEAVRLSERKEFFRPNYDWEDVLDRE